MRKSVFHKLSAVLWGVAVCAIVALAVYVSLGRWLSTHIEAYQEEILAQLNQRVPFHIEARTLRGEWRSFTPELVLSDLRLSLPGEDGDTLDLSGGRIGIDVLGTLSSRSLQVSALQLDSMALSGELTGEGRIIFPGLTGRGGEVGEWLREFLLNLEHVTLRDHTLHLKLPEGRESRRFDFDLHLDREGSTRRIGATLVSRHGSEIEVVGRGVGNPFRPETFTGELFLDIGSDNLGAVREMLASPPGFWVDGSLASQWWLSWNRGKASLDTRVHIENAVVRPDDGEWALPLDEVSLQASLLERKNRWTVFASDFRARQGKSEITIPRIQLDAWGKSVRLRMADLPLAPLNQLLLAVDALPESVASVFTTLQPSGELTALQLSVGNITSPAAEWGADANFEGVQVQSWRGAPGVTSATGYLEISEKGGYVILDSQQFTMDFPTVYRQRLFYDDIHGTLNLNWDSDGLVLDSGLITAQAAEGVARALFRLNVPFTETEVGLEMDLLVGLANSHPVHRVKYVPYVLNPALLDWLGRAIGEGEVEQAAFVWRGSLRAGAAPRRTVQLFLNVANTALDYHPEWPAVSNVDGTIFIDDTNVSVWADSAQLLDSTVRRLSAEAWLADDEQMRLAIDGQFRGSATDGLAVVNESLLGRLAGGAFSQWRASGDLDADLQLELNLGDSDSPPQVDLLTSLGDVNLEIEPGGLSLQGIGGELRYSTKSGFSSRGLAGRLWRHPLSVEVSQEQLPGAEDDAGFGDTAIRVALASTVAMDDLRQWLGIEALGLAKGESAVEGLVEIISGEMPRLHMSSDLVGVALDLPPPWSKQAEEHGLLDIELPLGSEPAVLDLALDGELELQLDISGGELRSAALGISSAPPLLVPHSVEVSGRAELVDVTAIGMFIDRYLVSDTAAPGFRLEKEAEEKKVRQFDVRVHELQAGRLSVSGREFSGVQFSLDYGPSGWQADARTDWAQGSYNQPRQGPAALRFDTLELSGLDGLVKPSGDGSPEPFQLPRMTVDIDQLGRNGVPLGDLHFDLDSAGGVIRAENIRGVLAGMALPAEQPASLTWDQSGDTRLEARLLFADFGATLQQLGYEKFLETERGRLELDLAWPGAPEDFTLSRGRGSVLIDMKQGRFLDTPARATGALKVVSVLNLAGVVERLSLSHMFESGIPFDNLDGEILLQQGTIEVPGIDVVGGLSGFSFNGVSDIAARTLDGELVATLPVANNLPWVAALAGGLPVAAGVFVVSKVFEKQMNKLSSGVYHIGGTWDEPELSFDRIFDDETRNIIRQLTDPNEVAIEAAGLPVSLDPNQPELRQSSPPAP